MPTQTLTFSVAGGSSAGLSYAVSVESGAEVNISEAYTAANDQLVAFVLDVSQCKSLFMVATTAITLETNSSSAAARTLTMAANEPVTWFSTLDTDLPIPFSSTDVTALYISAASAGTFYLRCVYDPTV